MDGYIAVSHPCTGVVIPFHFIIAYIQQSPSLQRQHYCNVYNPPCGMSLIHSNLGAAITCRFIKPKITFYIYYRDHGVHVYR